MRCVPIIGTEIETSQQEVKKSMSKYSKKVYVIVAETLAESTNKYDFAMKISAKFQLDNERFDFKRFAKAAHVTI
jgi:ribonucleotide monophosphatase NagD (HAD superfamily)